MIAIAAIVLDKRDFFDTDFMENSFFGPTVKKWFFVIYCGRIACKSVVLDELVLSVILICSKNAKKIRSTSNNKTTEKIEY